MKRLILFLILATAASAYTLSDYPSFFVHNGKFTASYVVSDESPALDVVSATVISTALAKYPNVTTAVGTAKLDSEIANILTTDAIVIGSPCESKSALALEGNPDPCYKNIGGSAGYIKLFENNGHVQLLITGLTAADRNAAAKFIANQPLNNLKINTYVLPTTTNSTPPFFVQKNTTNFVNTTAQQVNTSQNQNTTFVPANATIQTPLSTPAQKMTAQPYVPIKEVPVPEKQGWLDRLMAWVRSWFS